MNSREVFSVVCIAFGLLMVDVAYSTEAISSPNGTGLRLPIMVFGIVVIFIGAVMLGRENPRCAI